ncbi:hypothetical protein JKP88DRAFT_252572 [Tribonema minus]|uniref:Uncharacterized protein n=1 Tax=Tribonema minus TaxID=303371 RepID=A0A835ZBC3_9STRA|nr:hypothetical protein JKP88DRAFT_252572 [Tribonema minus]
MDANAPASAVASGEEQVYIRAPGAAPPRTFNGLPNGAQIQLLRLHAIPACSEAPCSHIGSCEAGQQVADKVFWQRPGAARGKAAEVPQKLTKMAVARKDDCALAGVVLRFSKSVQPGDVWTFLKERLGWCDSCARQTLRISRLTHAGADKIQLWQDNCGQFLKRGTSLAELSFEAGGVDKEIRLLGDSAHTLQKGTVDEFTALVNSPFATVEHRVRTLLSQSPALANLKIKVEYGDTLPVLSAASRAGNVAVARALVEYKADINAVSAKNKTTALFQTAANAANDVMDLLLEKGTLHRWDLTSRNAAATTPTPVHNLSLTRSVQAAQRIHADSQLVQSWQLRFAGALPGSTDTMAQVQPKWSSTGTGSLESFLTEALPLGLPPAGSNDSEVSAATGCSTCVAFSRCIEKLLSRAASDMQKLENSLWMPHTSGKHFGAECQGLMARFREWLEAQPGFHDTTSKPAQHSAAAGGTATKDAPSLGPMASPAAAMACSPLRAPPLLMAPEGAPDHSPYFNLNFDLNEPAAGAGAGGGLERFSSSPIPSPLASPLRDTDEEDHSGSSKKRAATWDASDH